MWILTLYFLALNDGVFSKKVELMTKEFTTKEACETAAFNSNNNPVVIEDETHLICLIVRAECGRIREASNGNNSSV